MNKTVTVALVTTFGIVLLLAAMAQTMPREEDLTDSADPVEADAQTRQATYADPGPAQWGPACGPELGASPGPATHAPLDITTLQSYKIHPDITEDMLRPEPDDPALTAELGIAYDELNLAMLGYEEHIRPQYVEFLKSLEITVFGVVGDVLEISIHPSQEDRLGEIRRQLDVMYPDVCIRLGISPGVIYEDTATESLP